MNWTDLYRNRLNSADDALKVVRSGHRVWVQPGCAVPEALVEALVRRAPYVHGVEVVQMLTLGDAPYSRPEYAESFRANALFVGSNLRQGIWDGRADYTPIHLSEIEGLFSSGQIPIDTALIQVSPPDSHGFLSLGVGVDCSMTVIHHAKHVIAQVNNLMPRTHGDTFVHVSQVSALVEDTRALAELKPEPCTDLHRKIAAHVASMIPDGATLQMGIGGVPDAVLACLTNHKDLGIHTEMFSEGVIPLIESGVINGARKSLHPGKLVAGFVLATRKVFDFIHDNPIFEFHPIKYVNDPFVIRQNDRMVAINSALQVDLTGQVCSDSLGCKPYSGFGGQVDFIRGAGKSKGGVPIIALPSTAKNGTVSRIAPMLDPGAGVVTSRADVHYVVTEHGIADLHGKTIRERAEALIAIADPKFRDQLSEFAFRARYIEPRTVLA